MPRRFDVLQAEMERETGHLLSQVDKGGLAFGVALDGWIVGCKSLFKAHASCYYQYADKRTSE